VGRGARGRDLLARCGGKERLGETQGLLLQCVRERTYLHSDTARGGEHVSRSKEMLPGKTGVMRPVEEYGDAAGTNKKKKKK